MALKRIARPTLKVTEKWVDGYLVTFAVSYRYNGGIVINEKFYEGFTVPAPRVPKGYVLTGIGCGLQLNARPPFATQMISRKDGKPCKKSELKAAIKKLES